MNTLFLKKCWYDVAFGIVKDSYKHSETFATWLKKKFGKQAIVWQGDIVHARMKNPVELGWSFMTKSGDMWII